MSRSILMRHSQTLLFGLGIFFISFFLISCSASRQKKAYSNYSLGNHAFENGDLIQALNYFQHAQQFNPKDPDVEHMIGLTHLARGDFDAKGEYLQRAENHLLSAIKKYPDFEPLPNEEYGRLTLSEARVNLSAIYLQMGKWDESIEYARKAMEDPLYRFPDRANYNLGIAYFQKGQPYKAINHLKMAVDINRNFPGGYKTLGEIYLDLKRYPEALESFHKAIEAYNKYTEAYYLIGITYQRQNRRADARKFFRKCYSIDPEGPFSRRCKDFLE